MNNIIRIETKIGSFNLKVNLLITNGINCLFGPSGSGKTSIVNCIAGLIKPTSAIIKVNNEILNNSKNKYFLPIHKRKIGYVFQDARLFPHLTVKQNLLYGQGVRKYKKKIFFYEDIVDLLQLRKHLLRYPYNLSGGEKQRVSIGRAILSQPDFIIMDEPLASLDKEKKDELLMYIIKINKKYRIPIIYVSHSLFETFLLGKNISFINNGKILFSGNKEKALKFYNNNTSNSFEDSYIVAKISKIRKKDGLSELNIGKDRLLIFTNEFKLNSKVLIKIKSSNIIISILKPKKQSSLNYLKVTISDIIPEDFLICLILKLDNYYIKAHITLMSYRQMKIRKGQVCYALIKALNINDVLDISLV